MPLEAPLAPVETRIAALNTRYKHHSATSVIERALSDAEVGRTAMVSSFGAESVVLLHMVSIMDRTTPVLFIDTEMLFPETLDYQSELAEKLHLSDIRTVKASRQDILIHDNEGLLHLHDSDACCDLRKTRPLEKALEPFDAWITGRKRYQGGKRVEIEFFENEMDKRIKINPLAHWSRDDLQDYITENRLPRHPLVAQGYPSIGCKPCTSKVMQGEDERAGRWRDQDKTECGIHFLNGKMVRGSAA
ncbi:phosphoadenylyl-sulfate reductase [Aestuariibius sp. HNIBRBA575]|uniref:phosphoadenylyl-sulfate reductase n=1 Tax=Aestuariibius sp. HNIBRBA575 TaxID=3233343 RepID=UPI0034A10D63